MNKKGKKFVCENCGESTIVNLESLEEDESVYCEYCGEEIENIST